MAIKDLLFCSQTSLTTWFGLRGGGLWQPLCQLLGPLPWRDRATQGKESGASPRMMPPLQASSI